MGLPANDRSGIAQGSNACSLCSLPQCRNWACGALASLARAPSVLQAAFKRAGIYPDPSTVYDTQELVHAVEHMFGARPLVHCYDGKLSEVGGVRVRVLGFSGCRIFGLPRPLVRGRARAFRPASRPPLCVGPRATRHAASAVPSLCPAPPPSRCGCASARICEPLTASAPQARSRGPAPCCRGPASAHS